MIDIKIEKHKKLLSLSAIGHAGYAPYGADIVCAGVSSIIMGLCASLDGSCTETHISSGRAIIRTRYCRRSEYMFRFAEKALGLIAAEYPKHLKLSVNTNARQA